jgi:hypothetical protein
MIERLAVLSLWVAAMSGVVGILSTLCGCVDVATYMAYAGGVGYTVAAGCAWRIIARDEEPRT